MYRHKQTRKQRVRREVSGLLQHSGEKDVYAYVYAYTLREFRQKTLIGKKEQEGQHPLTAQRAANFRLSFL